jgi:hypothetical protein
MYTQYHTAVYAKWQQAYLILVCTSPVEWLRYVNTKSNFVNFLHTAGNRKPLICNLQHKSHRDKIYDFRFQASAAKLM